MELPQHIEVWYLIPSLRKSLAEELVKKGFTQKKTAELLDVTEPAISQYLKSKSRGQMKLPKELISMIKNKVKMIETKNDALRVLYELTNEAKKCGLLCRIHRQYNNDIPKECKICNC